MAIQVVVQIETGPEAGRKFIVRLGEKKKFGRSEKADFALPKDSLLSGVHFEIECAETGCHLRDLGSRNGTKLNGARIKESILRSQDYIIAGQTGFSISFVTAGAAQPEAPRAAAPPAPAAPRPAPLAPKPSGAPPAPSFEANWNAPVAEAPRPKPVEVAPPAAPQEPVNLLDFLREQQEPLYAVLDAARDLRVMELLRAAGYLTPVPEAAKGKAGEKEQTSEGGGEQKEPGSEVVAEQQNSQAKAKPEIQSLFDGYSASELEAFAPYLVHLPPESELLEILVREGWGKSWGIYLTCPKPFAEVRKHLRHFLQVELPGGKRVHFRFYDPRVMRVFLPTCSPEEAKQWFGPVKDYLVEEEKPEELLRFNCAAKCDKAETIPVLMPAPKEETAVV